MKSFYAFKNVDNPDQAELAIYDEIGFWGTNAKSFYETLKGIKAKELVVCINSPGGSVVDGYAIYNMLRTHSATKTVRIDGIAASIASVIAMAGDKIIMPENALMFIHSPLVNGAWGNAEELRKIAGDLDKLEEGILSIYEARTGSDRAKIKKMMTEETMLTAKESKALGFADEIIPETKIAAKWDATAYFPTEAQNHVAAAFKQGAMTTDEVRNAEKNFPPGTSQGGQNNKEKTNMKTLDEALAEVASLKAENSTLKTSAESAKTQAHQEAVNTVKEQEKTRKTGILACRDKYNKDGDLDGIAATALAGDTTPDQFKDQVMEVINSRGVKKPIKKGEGSDDAGFEANYKNAKTDAERRELVRKNKVEARRLARG